MLKNKAVQVYSPGPEKASEVAALVAQTFAETFVGKAYYTQEIIDGYAAASLTPQAFQAVLSDPRQRFYLLDVEGRTAGLAHVAERDPEPCVKGLNAIYLNRLYLQKDFHRRGFGTLLLDECYAESRRRGYDWMWLSVWEHNFPALAFYERIGFRPYGEWEWPFESNGVRYVDRDLIYAREIPLATSCP